MHRYQFEIPKSPAIDPQEVIDKMRQITIERQLCFDHEEDARFTYPERWDDLADWLAGVRDGLIKIERGDDAR